jgi:hypothetical protein
MYAVVVPDAVLISVSFSALDIDSTRRSTAR